MAGKKFPFDRQFQIGIISLMMKRFDFLVTAVELIKPEYFEDEVLIWFYKKCRDYYLDYKMSPTQIVLQNELIKASEAKRIKQESVKQYVDLFNRLEQPVDAQSYLINEVVRFCRRQAVKHALVSSAPLIDSDDANVWDQIVDNMQEACNVGNTFLDIGIQYFPESKERIRNRALGNIKKVIPVGITEVDEKLNGGLKAGQLGIFMGGTGAGKSIALPHCGKAAIIRGYKVLHYTFELDEDEVATRYDANWTATPVHDLRSQAKKVQTELEGLHSKYDNSLIIKYFPTRTASVNSLKSHYNQLKAQGFIPDMIIVDYGDLLKPTTTYNDEYSDLGAIFADLRGWAGELEVPMWTATQVNRTGMNSEIVDIDHIGDSLKKAQIADVLIAICCTREEIDMGVVRLFGAKNRNGPPKWVVPIKTAYDRMAFYVPGAPIPNIGKQPSTGGTAPPTLTSKT